MWVTILQAMPSIIDSRGWRANMQESRKNTYGGTYSLHRFKSKPS